ncbi:MAG: hypothetical protein V1798_04070 [Pseudomonadota bacterium]
MKGVLIITYVFPPVGGAGVRRTFKWTKNLPEFGWKPYVLTSCRPSDGMKWPVSISTR